MGYCVYKHTAPNGKSYIGITSRKPEKRWRNGSGYAHNPFFANAVQKHGWNNIKHEILYSNLSYGFVWKYPSEADLLSLEEGVLA